MTNSEDHKSADKFLNEFFYDNEEFTERSSLIRLPDATRIQHLRELAKKRLNKLRTRKSRGHLTSAQFEGYKFELDMWDWFYRLKPDWVNDPSEDFILDLKRYSLDEKLSDETLPQYKDKQQTDNFLIFGNHVFVIECKTSSKSADIRELNESIALFRELSQHEIKRIKKICGPEAIPVFIVCTKGFTFKSGEMVDSLQNSDYPTIILSEREREYIDIVFEESKSHKFAFNQFLGFFRQNQPDFNKWVFNEKNNQWKKDKFRIDAFSSNSGKGRKRNVFTFSIEPRDMLNISTVAHQKAKNIYEANNVGKKYYQRLLTQKRLKEVGNFLETNKTPFPNNILVSFRGKGLQFQSKSDEDNSNTGRQAGQLIFNGCPGTFHVIDGQHRLFGYLNVDPKEDGLLDSHRLIVTAFNDLTVDEEAEIFLEVNQMSQKVASDLLMEIEYSAEGESRSNLLNAIVFNLRDKENSSLFGKIAPAEEKKKKGTRPWDLKPTDLKSSLNLLNFIGTKSSYQQEKFWRGDFQSTADEIYEFLNFQLKIIEDICGFWFGNVDLRNSDRDWFTEDMGINNKGFLQNILMKGILLLVDEAIQYSMKPSQSIQALQAKTADIIETFARNLDSSPEKFDYFDIQKKYQFGSSGGSLACSILIRDFLSKDFEDIFSERHKQRIASHERNSLAALESAEEELDRLKEMLQGKKEVHERAIEYEKEFRSDLPLIFEKLFGEHFWDTLFDEDGLWDFTVKARKIRKQNEESLNQDPNPDVSRCEYEIQWLDWIDYKKIIGELFNRHQRYEKFLKKNALLSEASDLRSLLQYLFFIGVDKPSSKCDYNEGIKWMETYNLTRRILAHPVRGRNITPNQRKELAQYDRKVYEKLELWKQYL